MEIAVAVAAAIIFALLAGFGCLISCLAYANARETKRRQEAVDGKLETTAGAEIDTIERSEKRATKAELTAEIADNVLLIFNAGEAAARDVTILAHPVDELPVPDQLLGQYGVEEIPPGSRYPIPFERSQGEAEGIDVIVDWEDKSGPQRTVIPLRF